jgi:hypothetical protein
MNSRTCCHETVATSSARMRAWIGILSGSWGVRLFVNSLFNKRHVISEGNDTTDVFGNPYATIPPPRVSGLEFRIKY